MSFDGDCGRLRQRGRLKKSASLLGISTSHGSTRFVKLDGRVFRGKLAGFVKGSLGSGIVATEEMRETLTNFFDCGSRRIGAEESDGDDDSQQGCSRPKEFNAGC